jgi:hypothetical protein
MIRMISLDLSRGELQGHPRSFKLVLVYNCKYHRLPLEMQPLKVYICMESTHIHGRYPYPWKVYICVEGTF